jgi:hypothetical protein
MATNSPLINENRFTLTTGGFNNFETVLQNTISGGQNEYFGIGFDGFQPNVFEFVANTVTSSNAFLVSANGSPRFWIDQSNNTHIAGSLTLPNGSAFSNAPEFALIGSSPSVAIVTLNAQYGGGKLVRAATVENFVGTASTFTCSSNPTISIIDCGTSAGACTSGTTTLASVTLTAANTQTDGTVSTPGIAAGHYWSIQTVSGSCTALAFSASAGMAMQ